MGSHLKVVYQQLGGHVHCMVFSLTSQRSSTYAKNGDLVFSVEEWPIVKEKLERIASVEERVS
jgi:hypothetical protein